MGWKLLKEHYKIEYLVQVTEKGICIGSEYIHDLIIIGLDGTIIKANDVMASKDLLRYMTEMKSDTEKLRELVQAQDTFESSITVYTYKGGKVIEKKCEKLGWPNLTHDGFMMYENTFSADKNEVVALAKENAIAKIESYERMIGERKDELTRFEEKLQNAKNDLAQLDKLNAPLAV